MINIIYPCYKHQWAVDRVLSEIKKYSLNDRKSIHFIFVDDGTEPPLEINPDFELNYTHYQILEDIPWNHSFARNLAFKYAKCKWACNLDIDHYFAAEEITKLLEFCKDGIRPDQVYYFERVYDTGELKKIGANIYMIGAEQFRYAGYYDEDFCGSYGFTDSFLKERFRKKFRIKPQCKNIKATLYRYKVDGLSRDTSRNKKLFNEKMKLVHAWKYKNGPILRYKWKLEKEVFFE